MKSTSTTVVADKPPLNIQITPKTTSQAPIVTATKNIIQAKTHEENAQVEKDEFIKIFSTPVHEQGETSSRYVDSTRCQLETNGEMCMFALTVSQIEPKNIKEAMTDSAWIEAMQEDHYFKRLDVWELVDRPLRKNVINMKWLWKNKCDEENTIICNKARLVAKGCDSPILINQAKYDQEILQKHGMTLCDSIGTPMTTKPLDADLSGTPVNQIKYRSMVRALMYLTTSRPDIVHATYSNHTGCLDTRKSTSGGIQFLGGDKLVSWSSKKQDCTSMQPYPSRTIHSSILVPSALMSDITLSRNRLKKLYNWETTTYGKILYDEDVHDLRSVETELSAIVFNDSLTFEETHSCEPMVSPLNDNKIDFRISFDESDDEDYTHTVSYFDDLDFFKDFENEFSAIVYNDALTSKLDFLTEPTISIQHIDEFNLKYETSLSECDEEEQNIIYFNDVFPFNVIYPDDSKSDKVNDDDKIDIKQSSGEDVPDTSNTLLDMLAILKPPIGCYTWRMDQWFRFDDLMKDFDQGSRCEMGERLKGLEASSLPYK
ncbi:retrovirus-related pol polyprotein from transposon TNT 1-94 [Tanacetum coccineum]